MSNAVVNDVSKEQIRCLISNVYDLQKMRISAGNRIVGSFYLSMGINPQEKLEKDDDSQKLLQKLKSEYKRITDYAAEKSVTNNAAIKALSKTEDTLKYIQNETSYRLVSSYMKLLASEEEAIKVLDKFVKAHPLWDKFFADVKGCGTLMSAVCIAYLDPYKARHVSCFFRYCGLDTVQDEDKDGNKLFTTLDGTYRKVRQKIGYTYHADGENYFGKVIKTGEFDAQGNEVITTNTGEVLDMFIMSRTVNGQEVTVYETVEGNEEYIGDVAISEHGRRKGDTEMFEYIDKNGQKAMKRGITYNPVIKTKLMGVLTGCLLKAKDPTYSTIYYDYRKRLDNSSKYANASDGHKNMMAQRYMIKQFLRNLWTTWRDLEGLPVDNPYEVEKLGNTPHKYNAYQVETHNRQVNS